ncbi:hypothetical protein [Nonomuraea recticatena]|uniref:Uncharacterized protein n=1 Tax=Nonomuraea recticatena TaxID=46178 RepID=A0ABP6ECY6_9ACTN
MTKTAGVLTVHDLQGAPELYIDDQRFPYFFDDVDLTEDFIGRPALRITIPADRVEYIKTAPGVRQSYGRFTNES